MESVTQVLLQYGYAILFVWVLLEQAGAPVPAVPVLLGVGALAGHGRMNLAVALCLAVAASLPADVAWFELGRRRGTRVLGLLCRVSLEPDSFHGGITLWMERQYPVEKVSVGET